MSDLKTKNDLLAKLRKYTETSDDDIIVIKKRIEEIFRSCPEILYALNEKDLETELFNKDGSINWEWNEEEEKYEAIGEWDRYFGANANIRPFIFFPQTQTEVKNYVCYQVDDDESLRGNPCEKTLVVTFTIFVHGDNIMDKLTGLPRHDLIASIIREKFAWLGVEYASTVPSRCRETVTDNNYVTRTVKYECIVPNNLSTTSNGVSVYRNKRW